MWFQNIAVRLCSLVLTDVLWCWLVLIVLFDETSDESNYNAYVESNFFGTSLASEPQEPYVSPASVMTVSEDVFTAATDAATSAIVTTVAVMAKRELSSSSLSQVGSAKKKVKFGPHLLDSESESSSSDEDSDY